MRIKDLENNEFLAYYKPFIDLIGDNGLISSLRSSKEELLHFFKTLPEEKYEYAYQEGKWTVKEVLLHLIDTERVFAYRSMRFARNDAQELVGFDQDEYVVHSEANTRSMVSLLQEFDALRNATICLFESFNKEMMLRKGVASGSAMSVRATGFIISGHQMHHLNVLKERYI